MLYAICFMLGYVCHFLADRWVNGKIVKVDTQVINAECETCHKKWVFTHIEGPTTAAEVEENLSLLAEHKALCAERDAAFQRGVAAMREAAVAVASKRANLPKHSDLDSAWCRSAECILDELRTLPDPEDTE